MSSTATIDDHIALLPSLTMRARDQDILRLATVLQAGFFTRAREGDTLLAFLLGLEGFSEEYLAHGIQTIFYNGDALDDLDTELAGATATVALGAAMPGLAGAIMRKGSVCGAFRKTRTVRAVARSGAAVEVRVKLFNTVARDLGPRLFAAGVRLGARDLAHFLQLRPTLAGSFEDLRLDGENITAAALLPALSQMDRIRVEVRR